MANTKSLTNMAQVKIYTEDTTNLTQFIGLPIPNIPADLLVAESHPTEADTIRIYRSDRDVATTFVLKRQLINQIQNEVGQFLVGDLGMDLAGVLTYLNDTVFSAEAFGLITDLTGPTSSVPAPGAYSIVVIDQADGSVKGIPDFEYITYEEGDDPSGTPPSGTPATQEWVTAQLADYFQTEDS